MIHRNLLTFKPYVLPQDTGFIQFRAYDSAGNLIPADSLPEDLQELRHEILHRREVEQILHGRYPDSREESYLPFLMIALFVVVVVRARRKDNRMNEEEQEVARFTSSLKLPEKRSYLVYPGSTLEFSDSLLEQVLVKYFPYFSRLPAGDRPRFLQRLRQFMRRKQFVIHAESGFREMPILVSASAVQFSFGLDDFLLPDFTHVHIFPEAFIGTYPTLRLLEGNVTGSNIHLSWTHFMNGYQYPENGENVGLHEFAHAYHLQFTESGSRQSGSFEKAFSRFQELAGQIYNSQSKGVTELYTANSLRNRDEFWAGTVELFFEKPAALANAFPELYAAVITLLRQDPLRGG